MQKEVLAMGKTLRERWPHIFLAVLAAAVLFGAGMYAQSRREAARDVRDFQSALWRIAYRLPIFEGDLDRLAARNAEDPTKNIYVMGSVRILRQNAGHLLPYDSLNHVPYIRSSDYPKTSFYLDEMPPRLLRENYADLPALFQMLALCQPIGAVSTDGSWKETLTSLEEALSTPAGQEALELLGYEQIAQDIQGGS